MSRQGQVNESTGKVEVRTVKRGRTAEIGTPRKDTRTARILRTII